MLGKFSPHVMHFVAATFWFVVIGNVAAVVFDTALVFRVL